MTVVRRTSIFLQGAPGRFSLAALLVLAAASLQPGCRSKGGKGNKGGGNPGGKLPVSVETLARGDIRRTIEFVGELRASESVEVSSKVAGRIETILVYMGDRVEKGDMLARIDDTDIKAQLQEAKASLAVARASITKAKAQAENASALLARKEKLAEKKLVTPQELDDARTSSATSSASLEVARSQLMQAQARIKLLKSQLSEAKIRASFSGFVDKRYLDGGAVVNPGTPILRMVRKRPILARFQVEERYIGEIRNRLSEGEVNVLVGIDAYPGEEFTGRIIRLSPALESESRTAAVEAEISNEDGRLMPSMYCRVRVDFGLKENVLMVPLRAVLENIESGGENHADDTGDVYVVRGEKAELVSVKLGWRKEEEAEVLGGLKEGDRVVVEGQASLSSGARVRIVDGGGGAPGRGPGEK